MALNDPIDPVIRLAISQWPDDAPRGAVTAFCTEYNLSRQTFYKLRRTAVADGPAAVLQPKSRRPHTRPTTITDDVKQHVLSVRAALEDSGVDHGPISVFDTMTDMGMTPPSVASIGRIFRSSGVAAVQPRKKPRSAYKRFVYPAPNCLWQIDGTERPLADGRTCTIFQLIDDHSRLALASHVDAAETAAGAIAVVSKAIAVHGVPQRFLSDNGTAFNTSRRGWMGQLMAYLLPLGVDMITGKPGKPTTQGKNERFHQTLFRWLDARPDPDSIAGMQALVDEFDVWYNTQRRHQGLTRQDGDGRNYRLTPAQAWQATPIAAAPTPQARNVVIPDPAAGTGQTTAIGLGEVISAAVQHLEQVPGPGGVPVAQGEKAAGGKGPVRATAKSGCEVRKVGAKGMVAFRSVRFQMGMGRAGTRVLVAWDKDHIVFTDEDGVPIIVHEHPPAGVTYVGNGLPQGPNARYRDTGKAGGVSPMS